MRTQPPQVARLLTIHAILKEVAPYYVNPVPHPVTLKRWLDDAQCPRQKTNPNAIRGGGPCYYSAAHVDRILRGKLLPGPLNVPLDDVASAASTATETDGGAR